MSNTDCESEEPEIDYSQYNYPEYDGEENEPDSQNSKGDSPLINETMPNVNLNSLDNYSKLPFLYLPSINLKLLIDSGASTSIINPKPADRFSEYFFCEPFTVTGFQNTVTSNNNVLYPFLEELGIKEPLRMHVVEWHNNFDALLGSEKLKKLNAKINYANNTLEINNITVPFVFG